MSFNRYNNLYFHVEPKAMLIQMQRRVIFQVADGKLYSKNTSPMSATKVIYKLFASLSSKKKSRVTFSL